MIKTLNNNKFIVVMVAALGLFTFPATLKAESNDPFSFDNSQWMSFDHYKDNLKHNKITPVTPVPDTTSDHENVATTNNKNVALSSSKASVSASPPRPLNLPVLPGVNKGFDVNVTSTEDDELQSQPLISNLDTNPKVDLPETNWQDASEAARQQPDKFRQDGTEIRSPINVRMSYLPSPSIRPAPPPEKTVPHKPPAVLMSEKKEEPKKSPEEAAACAAVTAYKKNQLEAIQSDRKTLAALQAAIAQLGLEKQLSFMAGASGSVDTQQKVDFPISSQSTVK